jgi:large subunit GTPase 1
LNAAVLQEARCQALEAEQLAAEKVALVDEAATQDEVDEAISDDDDSAPSDSDHAGMPRPGSPTLSSEESDDEHFLSFDDDHDSEDAKDPRTKVLSVLELEDLFKKAGPELACTPTHLVAVDD